MVDAEEKNISIHPTKVSVKQYRSATTNKQSISKEKQCTQMRMLVDFSKQATTNVFLVTHQQHHLHDSQVVYEAVY